MKNKKLFAILTLVCFMMTLMPVAAFAALPGQGNADFQKTSDSTSFVYTEDDAIDAGQTATIEMDMFDRYGNYDATTATLYTWVTKKGSTVPVNSVDIVSVVGGSSTTQAGPVYKLTATTNFSNSSSFDVRFYDGGDFVVHLSVVEPKFTESGKISAASEFDNVDSVVNVNVPATSYNNYITKVEFTNDDKYQYEIYNDLGAIATITVGSRAEVIGQGYVTKQLQTADYEQAYKVDNDDQNIVVYSNGAYYKATIKYDNSTPTVTKSTTVENVAGKVLTELWYTDLSTGYDIVNQQTVNADEIYVRNGYRVNKLNVKATDVTEKTVRLTLYSDENADVSVGANNVVVYNGMKALAGKTLTIEPVGSINVDKTTVTTDRRGQATFKVSGKYEGTYKIYVSCGSYGFTIDVQVGSSGAVTIKAIDVPTNPVDLLGTNNFDLEFEMYDVNGNVVDADKKVADTQGWYKAAHSDDKKLPFPVGNTYGETVDATGYVALVSQPAGSKITNADLTFDGTNIISAKQIEVEGTYEFRVTLDNGNYATAKIEVKEFQTPVELKVIYPASVELGGTVTFNKLYWVDANGTQKNAFTKLSSGARQVKVNMAATGYAVANFNSQNGNLTAKTDEKYVGDIATITAVDERYNLVASTTVKIANDAKDLKFATNKAEVDVNNTIRVSVVDQDGTVVSLGNNAQAQNATTEISYVILDKPEGAKVFANTVAGSDKLKSNGYFDMNLVSDKVGNVAVQAVVKYSYLQNDETQGNKQLNVVKYYTGSQIFAVGTGSTGDVVVMSIGSNEIVINDTVKTIDAEPMIQNDRTYVPFRALAEAFGATVAYDEATQAVTAELNGVTVVMTIGSATYTVNGAEKTMDVAPFINGSRTMVPVRFAAEAFGIKVIPTYNPDGTTADILFNL